MSKYNEIDFKIINDAEMLALFKELDFSVQKKIVATGMRKAAKPIIETAKTNFNATKKGKSLTGYADLNSSFKIEESKGDKNSIGYKVGVKYIDKTGRKNWYKYRFIEWGTNEREYVIKKKNLFNKPKGSIQKTGKMTGTHFFYDAVEARKEQAVKDVGVCVTAALESTVRKYNKSK